MAVTYHLKIKKNYAAELIEDLEKAEAIEFTKEESPEDFEIPDWQKESVMARLVLAQQHPERLVTWKEANERLKKLID